ncbi:hypothetical protein RvY_08362 [Ramazzottius varieornatus]|uniref:GST N-terminal domain-containing protein n=1 Tax=Ramazzottius varieornatus TaxID=947166 RepID=A0A1D1V5J4_RAMVA|nr:hypothetical protein RvY_08362 [Ramazzottius varieornatus]
MASKVTVHYFDIPGRAEAIRWIFSYAKGTDWTDHRVLRNQWDSVKEATPFGQVPYAILRYMARQYNLMGSDAWEDAQVDALADYIAGTTYNSAIISWKYKVKLKIMNKANQNFLVGEKLTWVVFLLTVVLDKAVHKKEDLVKPYPLLKAHSAHVHNLKGVKDWREKYPVLEPRKYNYNDK